MTPESIFSGGSPSWSVAGWLSALFFLAAGVNQLLRLVDRFKEKPSPALTYVTKAEFSEAVRVLEARLEANRSGRESDRAALSGEIADLRESIGGDIRALHGRVDSLPAQIIAMLANTRALNG